MFGSSEFFRSFLISHFRIDTLQKTIEEIFYELEGGLKKIRDTLIKGVGNLDEGIDNEEYFILDCINIYYDLPETEYFPVDDEIVNDLKTLR